MPTIYDVLLVDHQKQRDMLRRMLETSGDEPERRKLLKLFADEAVAHANAEEQTVYAELMGNDSSQEEARHSVAEHYTIDKLVNKLEDTDLSSSGWLATCEQLQHAVEHHLEEEEGQIFDLARDIIGESQSEDMARVFAERKQIELAERQAGAVD